MSNTPTPTVARAVRATYAVFIASGVAISSWFSRIPQVRDHLHLSASQLGLVLLSIAAGSMLSLPLAGVVVGHIGSSRTVAAMAVVEALGLALVGVGYAAGTAVLVGALALLGFANGMWDVAMNVHGAQAEQALGKAIMPRFHAGFSVGTVAGAALGSLMIALSIPVPVHLALIALGIAALVPLAARGFLTHQVVAGEQVTRRERIAAALIRWRERRTVLIGLFVLAFAFAEGAGNDWISVATIDGYRVSTVVGSLAYALFLAAMTAARWFGPAMLERHGRVVVLRSLAVLALIGLLIFVYSPVIELALVGVLLWGAGVALGFPVGMSAAADEPAAAAARVSVVSSIGYGAFLGGPPLIGFLGAHFTVLHGLLVLAVLLVLAFTVAAQLRPLN